MSVITGGTIIEGVYRGYSSAAAPTAGVNEVQTLTIGATPTGGSFKLAFDGQTSAAIPWNATNATLLASLNAALVAMANIGTAGCIATAGTLTAGVGTITLTFGGNLAGKAVNTITVADNSLTPAATLTCVEATPGVTASGRGAATGATLTDLTNGLLYQNTGTALAPTWTKVGLET